MDLLSASQISAFDECERKGAWKYIAKIQTPQHPSAALGTEVDDTQLQPLLRDGRALDYTRESGYIAATALEFLPHGSGHNVQQHFVMPSPTWREGQHVGFGYQGFLDLWLPDGSSLPDSAFDPKQIPNGRGSVPAVVDFKTTGDLRWQKSATQLSTDVQAQLYATWAMYQTKSRVVDLVWIYMQTRKARKARRTHLRVIADQVADQFTKINERALRIHALKQTVTDPLELPANPDACEAYGGCPFRDRCNLGPGEIADALAAKAKRGRENMSEAPVTTTGLLARTKAKRDGIVTTPMPTQLAPPASPAPLSINPPESKLAPAPPVGSIEPAPAAPAAEAPPVRRGPGRPRKNPPKDPVGADAAAHSTPHAEPPTPPAQDTVVIRTAVDEAGNVSVNAADVRAAAGQGVRVVWGKERFQPVSYNDFEIGPFEATGFARSGESIAQAQARIYAELETFAEAAREKKAASYAKFLGAQGGAR